MIDTWILDLVIKDAEMGPDTQNLNTPLWFVIKADGLPQPVHTSQALPSSNPQWNFPVRLILQLNDISRAYLYVTLCTFKPGFEGPTAIARSRIGLRSMPIGSPKQFKFPLMLSVNPNSLAAHACFMATLSPIQPKPSLKPLVGSNRFNETYTYPTEEFYGSR